MSAKIGDSEAALRNLITRYVYAALEDEDIAAETVVEPGFHTSETLLQKDVKLKARVSFSLDVAQVWNQIFGAFCAEVAVVAGAPDDASVDTIMATINAECDEPISLDIMRFGANVRPLFGPVLTKIFDPTEIMRAHMIKISPALVSRPCCTAKIYQAFDVFVKAIALYLARLLHYNDTTVSTKIVFGVLRLANIKYNRIDDFVAGFREKKKKPALSSELRALASGGDCATVES